MKPFLKWAGNKYSSVKTIKAVLPMGKRLIEPFVGSGAVFLNTQYPKYLLTDSNADLIAVYQYLKSEGKKFIAHCEKYFLPENNFADYFYEQRALFNSTNNIRLKAVLFVYLNKHCFNGLCRYNSKGEFNTPFGRFTKPYFPAQEMQYFHEKLQNAEIKQEDFRSVMNAAKSGDVIYCDPPYVPLSKTANFTSYAAGNFGEDQQLELVALAERLSAQGIPVLISNHNTTFTQQAYRKAAKTLSLTVKRSISANAAKRGAASEILAIYS